MPNQHSSLSPKQKKASKQRGTRPTIETVLEEFKRELDESEREKTNLEQAGKLTIGFAVEGARWEEQVDQMEHTNKRARDL